MDKTNLKMVGDDRNGRELLHVAKVQTATKSVASIYPSSDASIQSPIHVLGHLSSHPSVDLSFQPSNRPSTGAATYQPLTPAQGKVLIFLIQNSVGATNVELISGATQVPVGTVKDGLRILLKKGFILEKGRIVQHDFHGFRYSLDHQKCKEYVAKTDLLTHSSIHQSAQLSINPVIPLSSSSYSHKTTTKTLAVENLDHPELDYWTERGLTTVMVAKWTSEFAIPAERVIQALKHAAFDIPCQEEKRGEQIDPFNWFYAGLKRYGTYRRPTGYKPLEQVLLDEARAERIEKEKLAKDLADERMRGENAAQELKFQLIMENPSGTEYKHLKAHVSTPGGLPLSGKMLEASMREAFTLITSKSAPAANDVGNRSTG
jgi:hypothetical protein